MKKHTIKTNKYKILLTSVAIAGILSNASGRVVYATTDSITGQTFLEPTIEEPIFTVAGESQSVETEVAAKEAQEHTLIEGGIIHDNLVLTKENSPYKIVDNIQLSENGSLEIHAGVVIDGNSKNIEVHNSSVKITGIKDDMVVIKNLNIIPKVSTGPNIPEVEIEYAEFIGGTPSGSRSKLTLINSILRNTERIDLSYAFGDSIIEGNIFIDAKPIELAPYKNYSEAHIKNNHFEGGSINILVSNFPEGKTFIQYNSFNPSQYAIKVTNGTSSAEINADDNYWGTTNTFKIDEMIFDKKDDLNSGAYVKYDKILQEPHVNTPQLSTISEEIRTEDVAFETEYVNNADLMVGTEEVSQEGVNGFRTIVEEVLIVSGEEIRREVILDEITTVPVNQVVQVGTKEITEETRMEDVAFEIEYVNNSDLMEGTEEVSQEGVFGVRTIVEEVVTVEGVETAREVIYNDITTAPVNQVVQMGTKEITEETRTEDVAFETEYVNNSDLLAGTEEVSQEGVNGVRTIVEEVVTVEGVETTREVISDEVTTAPVNKIVQVGIKAVTEETRTEDVAFETEYVNNSDFMEGTEEVSQEGVNGVRTIVEEVTTVEGVETSREVISNEVTKAPVNRVIQVGTKVVEKELEILEINLDKDIYRPGGIVNVTVELSNITEIETAEMVFGNTMSMDAEFLEINNFVKDAGTGNYIGSGSFTISEFPVGFEAHFYIFEMTSYDIDQKATTLRYDYANPDEKSPLHNVGFDLLNPLLNEDKVEVLEVRLDKDVYRPEETPQLTMVVSGESEIDYVTLWFAMKESGGWPEILVDNFERDEETGNYVGTTTLDLSYYAFGYTEPFHPFTINAYDKSGNVTEIQNDYYAPETINPLLDASFTIEYTDKESEMVITEESRTEEVAFEIEYVNNPDSLVGTEEVSQEGVNGVRTIVEEVTTVGGVETAREVISDDITTAPVNKIVQVGTREVTEETRTEEVAFEIEYVNNPNLLVGTEEVSQDGANGVRTIVEEVTTVGSEETARVVISSDITTAPVNQVVQVGTREITEETRTEEVAFEIEYINNSDLMEGTEEVSQEGVVGVRTIVEEVTTIEGVETDRVVISNDITTSPVNQVVQEGTKEVSEKTRIVEVAYETEYVYNPDLLVGEEEVSQEGVMGARTFVEEVTTVEGVETDRVIISDEVTTAPVNRVVQVGTKAVVEETRSDDIAYEIEYVNNPSLLVGKEEVSQEGVVGVRTIAEKVTLVEGVETDRVVISDEVTTAPVNQVVQVGTKAVAEETRTEEIAFEIEYVNNSDLLVGTEEVSQDGANGVRTIVEEVITVEGVETTREVILNDITTAPVNKVVQVGTKAVEIEEPATVVTEEARTEEVAFEIEYVNNPNLLVGTEEVSQDGANGVRTIVEEIITVEGEETVREGISNEITTAPVNQVVQVGTGEEPIQDIDSKVLVEKNTGISVKASGTDKELNLTAIEIMDSTSDNLPEMILGNSNAQSALVRLGAEFTIFDIHLSNEQGIEVTPTETVTVLIPYDSNRKPEKLYHFGDNFGVINEVNFIDNGDSIEFVMSNFSYFGIQFEETETAEETETPEDTETAEETETPEDTETAGETELPEDTETPEETETLGDKIEQDDPEEPKESETLPSTATPVPFIGVVGLSLAALGSVLAFFKKKQ